MSFFFDDASGNPRIGKIITVLGGTTALLVATMLGGCPQYSVYQQKLEGEAELAKANFSKQVAVQEAQAKMDGAKLLAQAEIERAKGVAEANKIIGDSLHNNEDYLRYLFVNSLEHTQNQVIYVPTEANLPILEASRKVNPPPL